ncbi:MAG: hypothetical protein ACREQV_10990 [Candidatus Binatia bacterium]
MVATEIVEIKAGFSWDITDNILGRIGFFENFIVTFNHEFPAPCFDIQRIDRH